MLKKLFCYLFLSHVIVRKEYEEQADGSYRKVKACLCGCRTKKSQWYHISDPKSHNWPVVPARRGL